MSSETPRRYSAVVAIALVVGSCLTVEARAQEVEQDESALHQGSQHVERAEPEAHHEPMGRHRVVLFLGNTLVPAGSSRESDTVIVPTVGFDYSYWASRKLGFGVAADFELASYLVETEQAEDAHSDSAEDGGTVERDFAAIVALLVLWEPIHRVGFFVGPGREFEAHESFWLLRVGAEYAFPLPAQWAVAATVIYDHKEVYDAWSLGVVFAKRFGSSLR
jgi:hypothetical protein